MTEVCPLCNTAADLRDGFCEVCQQMAAKNYTTPQILLEKKVERENRIPTGGGLDEDALAPTNKKRYKLTKKGRRGLNLKKIEEDAVEILDKYPKKWR